MPNKSDYADYERSTRQHQSGFDEALARDIHYPSTASAKKLVPFFMENRKLILATTIVVGTLFTLYSVLAFQEKYGSDAAVIIKDSAVTAKYVTPDVYTTTSSLNSSPVLNTMELLKGDVVVNSLWKKFISKYPEDRKKLKIDTLQDWQKFFGDGKKLISQKNTAGTDVIYLSFKWTSPEQAQEGMQIVLNAFQQASRAINQTEQHQRYLYLTQQATDVRKKLYQVRQAISRYKQTHHVSDIDQDILNFSKSRMEFEVAMKTASSDTANYKGLVSGYESTLGMPLKKAVNATALGKDDSLSKLYDQYYGLSQEYAAMATKYTDTNPRVKDVKSRLNEARQNIQLEISRSGITPKEAALMTNSIDAETKREVSAKNSKNKVLHAHTASNRIANNQIIADDTRSDAVDQMITAQAQSKGMQLKTDIMRKYLESLNNRLKEIPKIHQDLDNMQEDEKDLSASLDSIEQQVMDAKLREAQTASNVFVISQAKKPELPLFPNKLNIIEIGLVLGLLAGYTLAKMKEKYV